MPDYKTKENQTVDFENLSYEDIDEHVMQQIILEEDSMSPIIRGHLFNERTLTTLISRNMQNAISFFQLGRNFSLINDLAFGMALIDKKHYSAYKALNKIRNNCAHKHNHMLDVDELNSLKFDWEEIQHKAYRVACKKSPAEAAKIAVLFLCWKTILLIKEPENQWFLGGIEKQKVKPSDRSYELVISLVQPK